MAQNWEQWHMPVILALKERWKDQKIKVNHSHMASLRVEVSLSCMRTWLVFGFWFKTQKQNQQEQNKLPMQ